MVKLFLASHGKFASGIKNSIDILTGQSSNLVVFDAYIDERSIDETIEQFFKSVNKEDQVILLSDLYGGSVNQVMIKYLNRSNVTLISGVNLLLVLELSISTDDFISRESINEIINNCKENIQIVDINDQEIVEDDFF